MWMLDASRNSAADLPDLHVDKWRIVNCQKVVTKQRTAGTTKISTVWSTRRVLIDFRRYTSQWINASKKQLP